MAQNITLMGAAYADVPAITVPKTGGGTARFDDASVTTAVESDVAAGKIFLLADGTIGTGSNEGGGSVTWETMADQTCAITTYNGMRIITIDGYTEPFSADETYRVTWNDTQYICKTYAESQGVTYDGYVIGNSAIVNNGSDSGEPFIMYRTRATRLTGVTNDTTSSSVHVKIEKQVTSSNVPSGGSSSWTKVAETSYQVSTTSTSAATVDTWATGHSELWTSDKIVYVRVRDTAGKRTSYFYGSDTFFINHGMANRTSASSFANGMRQIFCVNHEGDYGTYACGGTNGYGVYPDTFYSDGRIRIRRRYNVNYSLTINSTYKVEVYLLDPADGVPIFE